MNSPESPHAIIVLGSGVTSSNRPGFDGKIRVLALQKLLKTITPSHVILTGGQIAGKQFLSEAEAMKKYLIRDGLVQPTVILEQAATDLFNGEAKHGGLEAQSIVPTQKIGEITE